MLESDIVDTEIGEHEVEIEAEEIETTEPDEILPDIKETPIKVENKGAPPPLRPLNIAPKPMALKTALVNAGTGQQIVFIQSPGILLEKFLCNPFLFPRYRP